MGIKPKVFVVGVGMTKFEKPGCRKDFDYPQMAQEAVTKALKDAKLHVNVIEQACIGYVYGESTCGQRAIYELGMNGIPIYNVNNNCATGSTAIVLAKQLIESGNSDCVLALGFEKMSKGSLTSKFMDRTNPMDKHVELMADIAGLDASPIVAQMFGNAGIEHMRKYGTKPEHFAKIAYKNHKHSVNNPYSQFRHEYTMEEIMNSPKVFGPLTKLQCCPTSDGAAAAIVVSEEFVIANDLRNNAVEILGIEMATDSPSTFNERSCIKIVGYDMTKNAAEKLYRYTKTKPRDIDVIELHDCFSANELITYEALGLCLPGKAKDFIDARQNTYGGRHVINPSGGLISKGHPLGATGIAQCAELCWQLRGQAGNRQVPNAKLALQHNIGLGGAVVVALYRLYKPNDNGNSIACNLLSGTIPGVFKSSALPKALKWNLEDNTDNIIYQIMYSYRVKNRPIDKDRMWIMNSKTGKGTVEFEDEPDVTTFIINDEDLVNKILDIMNSQKGCRQGNISLGKQFTAPQKKASMIIQELCSKL